MRPFFTLIVALFIFSAGTSLKAQNCSDLEYWSEVIRKEFPDVNISEVRSGSDMCRRIWYCLYSDKYFIPFAGKPYDEVNEGGRMRRWKKVRGCVQKKKYVNDKYMSWIHWIGKDPLSIKRIADEMGPRISEQRKLRTEYAVSTRSLEAGDHDFGKFREYEKMLQREFSFLSIAEIRTFSELIKNKKATAACRELVARAEMTGSLSNALTTINELQRFNSVNYEIYNLADNAARDKAATIIESKKRLVIQSLMTDQKRRLDAVPHTREGLTISRKIYNDFNGNYGNFMQYPEVKEIEKTIVRTRTAIVNSLNTEIRKNIYYVEELDSLLTIERNFLTQVDTGDPVIKSLNNLLSERKNEIMEKERLAILAQKEAEGRKTPFTVGMALAMVEQNNAAIKKKQEFEKETAMFFNADGRPRNTTSTSLADKKNEGSVLIFPTVIKAIYEGRFDVVPDDQLFRTYLVSVYKGIYDQCEPNGDGIGMTAGKYGVPQLKNLNKLAQESLGDFFSSIVEYTQSGDISVLQPHTRPAFYREGVEDGAALVVTYKCNSLYIRKLRIQLTSLFERRIDIEPEKDDAGRWKRLMHPEWRSLLGNEVPVSPPTRAELLQACIAAKGADYLTKNRCNCIIPKLMSSSISDKDRIELKKDWKVAEKRLYNESEYFRVYVNDPCRQ
ncbi:MAG: hypothetical protein KIT80_21060 [Chitinophagaceae bacterium]|nr:hypothetical protein [Chitinophagaceae bacterium]MCW5929424.1 hypothetical protein [Chitinophagaceae bacterium]